MAKTLTIVGLTNPTQLFGANATAYAMFSAVCDGNSLEIGVTHNSLTRAGYDTAPESLSRLVGCSVKTKDFVDRETGAIINGDERVEMALEGKQRLVLFNSLNHTIERSDIYKEENIELLARTNAQVKIAKEREIMNAKKLALLARIASRPAVADAPDTDETPSPEQPAELTLETESAPF